MSICPSFLAFRSIARQLVLAWCGRPGDVKRKIQCYLLDLLTGGRIGERMISVRDVSDQHTGVISETSPPTHFGGRICQELARCKVFPAQDKQRWSPKGLQALAHPILKALRLAQP